MNWRKSVIDIGLKLVGNSTVKYLDEIRGLSASDSAKIKEVQDEKLKKLIMHAYRNVPYYHDVFIDAGVVKNGGVCLKNFNKIPILTKDIIRNNFDELKSKDMNKRKWHYNTSGGSTGEPVRFVQDKKYDNWNNAVKLFYMEMVGKELGEKELKLWGSERDIIKGDVGLSAKLLNLMYNRKLLNSFKMTEKDMSEYVSTWNKYKPKVVWCYIDSVYELARFIEKNKLDIFSPEAIVVTAGTVSEDMRQYIEKVTGSHVYNQYGSREVGSIACECVKQNGLHVFDCFNTVEIVDEKIIVTNLCNYSMPLIRYEIGDTGKISLGKCKCGCGFHRLSEVSGRITDHFRKKDGTVIHGEYFTHLFYFKDWIKKFQVVQKDYNLIEVKVVVDGSKDEKDIVEIEKKIKLVMGKKCKVEFLFVDGIKPSKSGKYRYVMSEVE